MNTTIITLLMLGALIVIAWCTAVHLTKKDETKRAKQAKFLSLNSRFYDSPSSLTEAELANLQEELENKIGDLHFNKHMRTKAVDYNSKLKAHVKPLLDILNELERRTVKG